MSGSSRLVMSRGPQPGQTFVLDQALLILGRDPNSDIVISNPQISRKHARITRQGGRIVLEDLGSTNGTFVNGVRLTEPHTLENGDTIGLGDVATLTYYGTSVAATEVLGDQPPASSAPPSYPPSTFEPTPAYAAPPAPPAEGAAAPPFVQEEKKSRTGLWIGCGCLVLILACVAVGLFVWYAPASFWQALIDLGIPVPTWPF
jgi:predicted component of type VI protein secretion system